MSEITNTAFEAVLSAQTPQARAAALNELEISAYQKFGTPSDPAPKPVSRGASLLTGQDLAKTLADPASLAAPGGRQALLDQFEKTLEREAMAKQPGETGAIPEGFEGAAAHEYAASVPPEVKAQISDQDSYTQTLEAMANAGVPAMFTGMAFQEASRLAPIMESETGFEHSVSQCRDTLHKQYQAEAPTLIKNGLAYLEALAKADPRLSEATTTLMGSPWAVAVAANAWAAGHRPGKR